MRRLRYALAASLVLHLLVLWLGALRVLTKDTHSVLLATLHKPSLLATKAAPSMPPHAVPPAPTPKPAAPTRASSSLERPKPDSVPQTLVLPADPVLKSAPDSAGTAAAIPAPTPALATGSISDALVTEASASGEAADGLRGYRLAVATQARRFKRYPSQAMASGWEGSADIRVEVGSDGRPRAVTVARSSGREMLDRAALVMIDAGALRARLPDSLRGKAFAVVLPVVFNLEAE